MAVCIYAASFFDGILQSPSNCAPSLSTRLGVLIVHCTRAVAISSTRSRAVTSPLNAPAIVTLVAEIRALTTAPVVITTSSPVISPSGVFDTPANIGLGTETDFVATFLLEVGKSTEVEVVIVPPFTAIAAVNGALGQAQHIKVGAQNMHWERSGAFTGEISASHLVDAGCQAAGNVAQRDIGDRRVENLHESSDRDHQRDQPGVAIAGG